MTVSSLTVGKYKKVTDTFIYSGLILVFFSFFLLLSSMQGIKGLRQLSWLNAIWHCYERHLRIPLVMQFDALPKWKTDACLKADGHRLYEEMYHLSYVCIWLLASNQIYKAQWHLRCANVSVNCIHIRISRKFKTHRHIHIWVHKINEK